MHVSVAIIAKVTPIKLSFAWLYTTALARQGSSVDFTTVHMSWDGESDSELFLLEEPFRLAAKNNIQS